MRLLDDWQEILRRAWSVRLIILSGLLSGLEVALPVLRETIEPLGIVPSGTFAILAIITSAAAAIARLLVQPDGTK